MDRSDDRYNHALHPVNLIMQWFSRFTATFLGALFALIVFALLARFYFEMTVGKAIGSVREEMKQPFKK